MTNDDSQSSALSRRTILGAGLAFGAGGMLAGNAVLARAAAPSTRPIIDVHHHFFPPQYEEAWQKWQDDHHDFVLPLQKSWTPAQSLEAMDKAGVTTAIVSVASTPGIWFGVDPQIAIRMARLMNEYAAGMRRDHPGRFTFWASLPMLDIDASLKEIAYALDDLKAEGIGLYTNYGDTWPGDPHYAPVFEELNRRKAIVYFHPNTPNCCSHLVPGAIDALTEVPQDTNRAVESLLFSGTFARCRSIRWIFSHAGGGIPMLASRFGTLTGYVRNTAEIAPDGIVAELTRLYYEIADAFYPSTMAALLKFVPPSQIMFGTDYPYVSVEQTVQGLHKLGLGQAPLRAIESGTALRLLPHLKA